MASLYNRATPRQALVLRMVEGAIVNAAQAHPEIQVSPKHRRSIAKRAAGTLTAGWPDVLALGASERIPGSDSRKPGNTTHGPGERREAGRPSRRRRRVQMKVDAAGGSEINEALPLLGRVEPMLWRLAGPIRAMGDLELYEAVLAVIQILGRRRKKALGSGRLKR